MEAPLQIVEQSVSAQRTSGPLMTPHLAEILLVSRLREEAAPVAHQLQQWTDGDQLVIAAIQVSPGTAPTVLPGPFHEAGRDRIHLDVTWPP